uniref:Uncharacterized protein n=1 Tax=Corethron hystrix TaxID=216773 RepID=A0A7S1BKF4_9STRA|mmetsp:Transcript_31788/g.73014  ORF Transcript_31788/g.73014 Transcript_31788/m.73014 type:complete len:262 (+) Transcript_31788:959-1744(+)
MEEKFSRRKADPKISFKTLLYLTAILTTIPSTQNHVVNAFSAKIVGFSHSRSSLSAINANYLNNYGHRNVFSFLGEWLPSMRMFSNEELDDEGSYLRFLDRRFNRLHENDSAGDERKATSKNANIVGSVLAELASAPGQSEDDGETDGFLPQSLALRSVPRTAPRTSQGPQITANSDTTSILFSGKRFSMKKMFSPIRTVASVEAVHLLARSIVRAGTVVFLGSILNAIYLRISQNSRLTKIKPFVWVLGILRPLQFLSEF